MNVDKVIELVKRFGATIVAALLFVAFLLSSLAIKTTFQVDAVTEIAKLRTQPGAEVAWFFPPRIENESNCLAADHIEGMTTIRSDGVEIEKSFMGSLTFNAGVSVLLLREGKGQLRALARSEAGDSVGTIKALHVERVQLVGVGEVPVQKESGARSLGKEVEVEVLGLSQYLKAGCTWLLQLDGQIDLGQEAVNATQVSVPLLVSGKVKMLSRTLGAENFFEAGSIDLSLGDSVSVESTGATAVESGQPIRGLVRLDEQPAMHVIYRAVGQWAQVRRAGSPDGDRVSASLLNRIMQDPQAQRTWSAFLAIAVGALAWRKKGK